MKHSPTPANHIPAISIVLCPSCSMPPPFGMERHGTEPNYSLTPKRPGQIRQMCDTDLVHAMDGYALWLAHLEGWELLLQLVSNASLH